MGELPTYPEYTSTGYRRLREPTVTEPGRAGAVRPFRMRERRSNPTGGATV
jgi:hypothetical protein